MKGNILSLFFTRGVSLEIWVSQGLFDREKLLYEEHLTQNNLNKIYWFTYGSSDKRLAEQLKKEGRLHKDILIFEMPKLFNVPKIGSYLYSFFLPIIHKKFLKKSDILKTNQMDGSWSAVLAAKLYNKPLINRTGYTLSIFIKRKNVSKLAQYLVELVERVAYQCADINVVASNEDKNYLINKYGIEKKSINTIYNYIDTDLFKPLNFKKKSNRIIIVGRLNKQKNLFNLIEAISKTNLALDIYGQGDLKEELIAFSRKLNADVNFNDIVDNNDLPNILNRYKYYILVSLYEGMPKTLIEAMASGCLCIGTDVPGINEIISDGVNGILARTTTSESISKALKKAVNTNDKKILIHNGISFIKERCALGPIAQKEFTIFRDLVDAK